jgi:endonuclease/exonuclease/phosphatase family metal-dependent hydrolase
MERKPPFLLKLLTLNTHKGFSSFNRRFVLHELRDAVRGVSADIVFLQEVIGVHARHARRLANWPMLPQYEFLAETIWDSVAYGGNAVYRSGHHGNAVLSKFPMSHFRNHDASVWQMEKRGLLHCVIGLPQDELHVICAHLSLREAHRQRQLHQLCDLIEAEVPAAAPLVVAGDFNDWRGRAHRILEQRAGLSEAFIEAEGQAASSFPSRWPMLRLDRIYLRGARLRRSAVLHQRPWALLSDHLPLYAEISLA